MIRPALTSDLPNIRVLLHAVPDFWDTSWRADVLERALASPDTIALVHEEHATVDGFLCAHDVGFRAYLSELVVSPDALGRGIGAQLLGELERRLAARGCAVVIADAWRDAEPFYRSQGWTAPDVVLLRKRLDENPAGRPPTQSPDIRAGYDRWAQVYDRDGNPLVPLEEPLVDEVAGDVRGFSVLDLGCGTGRHALRLAAAGANVTAVDFSEAMLAEARRKPGADAIHFLAHDLTAKLPFDAGRFDLVVSGLVLEHLPHLGVFFDEAHRVLRANSRAIVSAMHPAMFRKGSQARFTDPTSGEKIQPGSFPHQIGDFVMAALAAGFRIDAIDERAPAGDFARRWPRAAKYVGWPMLVVLRMVA